MIGVPEAILLGCLALVLLALVLGRSTHDYADHGDARHAGTRTLAHYDRAEQRQGWDRDAHHCGPWRGDKITDSARTLRWVNK